MDPITKRIVIRADRHVRLDLDVPADFPEGEAQATHKGCVALHRSRSGEARATVKIRPLAGENRLRDIRGKGEGRFWMARDFDEPIEDIAD